LLYGFPEF
jgi:epoxide hydrolase 4